MAQMGIRIHHKGTEGTEGEHWRASRQWHAEPEGIHHGGTEGTEGDE